MTTQDIIARAEAIRIEAGRALDGRDAARLNRLVGQLSDLRDQARAIGSKKALKAATNVFWAVAGMEDYVNDGRVRA